MGIILKYPEIQDVDSNLQSYVMIVSYICNKVE